MASAGQGRKYFSALRSEQAVATRRRVVEAAARLFAERGYRGTTLAAIGAAAGVSTETVQAQGAKRQLLGAALQLATRGDQGDRSVLEAPGTRGLGEAETADQLVRVGADLMTTFNARTSGLWRAFGSAAADDPAVDQEWTAVMTGIHADVAEVVALMAARGWLRTDVPRDELVASLWLVIGAENFDKLTVRLSWSLERYRDWLHRSIAEAVLRPSRP
jgi:AcrR family transcriptional regulator